MIKLQIRKKTARVWQHFITDGENFILSKCYCKTNGDKFRVVEDGGTAKKEYLFSEIEVYDDLSGGSAETFTSSLQLMNRLSALNYVGFSKDGDVIIADLISSDSSNALIEGADGKLYVPIVNTSSFATTTQLNDGLATKAPTNHTHTIAQVDNLQTELNGKFNIPTGTINRLVKFATANTIGDSQIFDNGTNVGIGTDTPTARLDVRAQSTSASDFVFRIRNSTNTQNFLVVNGAGDVFNRGANGVNSNTFFGENVGRATTGNSNAFFGFQAGTNNTNGNENTFLGNQAGFSNIVGRFNTFVGFNSGILNLGFNNTSIGSNSLQNNVNGSQNTAIGQQAGRYILNGSNLTETSNSIFIGFDARALSNNQSNQIVIGHNAIGKGSNTVQLGNNLITQTHLQGQIITGIFATAPTGIEGAIYYDSTTKKHRGFNGTTWNDLY